MKQRFALRDMHKDVPTIDEVELLRSEVLDYQIGLAYLKTVGFQLFHEARIQIDRDDTT